MTGRQVHRAATSVLSVLIAAIGVALIIQVAAGHGSVASGRLLLGVLFLAAGAGRLYVERKRGRAQSGSDEVDQVPGRALGDGPNGDGRPTPGGRSSRTRSRGALRRGDRDGG